MLLYTKKAAKIWKRKKTKFLENKDFERELPQSHALTPTSTVVSHLASGVGDLDQPTDSAFQPVEFSFMDHTAIVQGSDSGLHEWFPVIIIIFNCFSSCSSPR
ncbi:hypothetical protein ADUPG1_008878 [Aduncisulcus paluster]|uniref:Uncharacterized protein n=1 Tax=Aduncisulcus paluster TaxID=2918883 RepID=A0ABQ5KTI9_9EUKA|nr:hypothetical protein ADUPG1_008878 [Aduncisulcus paluster]